MQDLNHGFASAQMSEKTAAALASIEAERRGKVRSAAAMMRPFAAINPKSMMVGLARLFVVGALGLWANYLLYMQIWGG